MDLRRGGSASHNCSSTGTFIKLNPRSARTPSLPVRILLTLLVLRTAPSSVHSMKPTRVPTNNWAIHLRCVRNLRHCLPDV